jgi:hypothetical protein
VKSIFSLFHEAEEIGILGRFGGFFLPDHILLDPSIKSLYIKKDPVSDSEVREFF